MSTTFENIDLFDCSHMILLAKKISLQLIQGREEGDPHQTTDDGSWFKTSEENPTKKVMNKSS